jgi:hypothetical protein
MEVGSFLSVDGFGSRSVIGAHRSECGFLDGWLEVALGRGRGFSRGRSRTRVDDVCGFPFLGQGYVVIMIGDDFSLIGWTRGRVHARRGPRRRVYRFEIVQRRWRRSINLWRRSVNWRRSWMSGRSMCCGHLRRSPVVGSVAMGLMEGSTISMSGLGRGEKVR